MYARYASEHWEVPLERVWVVAANLFHNDGEERILSLKDIEAAEEVVRNDVTAMVEIMVGRDPAGNKVEQASCAMTENTQTCKRCPFKEVCWGPDWAKLV
jgi:MoaA/NifB/PqqE/SkfB family radical SAM enzyme